jgi:hypothetical protein
MPDSAHSSFWLEQAKSNAELHEAKGKRWEDEVLECVAEGRGRAAGLNCVCVYVCARACVQGRVTTEFSTCWECRLRSMQCSVDFGYQLFVVAPKKTMENLDRVGRSQDLPDAH